MNDPVFRRISVSDFPIYERYYRLSDTRITDMTFTCRIAWDPVFRTQIAYYEDCCLLISDGGGFTDPHLLMPLGTPDEETLHRILLAVDREFRARGWKLKVMCVDENKVDLFRNLPDFSAEITYADSASDYIYDADALRTLSGNILHKKRNHVNRFLRLYPNYRYRRLQMSDATECLELVHEWCRAKGITPEDVSESDYLMIRRLFADFDALPLRGGLIEIGGKIRAFSIGFLGNGNTAYMHFEKADAEFDGIYAAINRLTLENEFPEAQYVNREEDMGLPGLMKSKQSYDPILKQKKYRVRLIRKDS